MSDKEDKKNDESEQQQQQQQQQQQAKIIDGLKIRVFDAEEKAKSLESGLVHLAKLSGYEKHDMEGLIKHLSQPYEKTVDAA